jgi:aspartyl-tRNA(Asn)/glutamyl-tRNA(Gln) amidotransferase subunit A
MTTLHDLSAQALSDAYRTKQLSPVEVTREALERIAAWEDKINAMYVVDEVGALAEASLSEARWRTDEPLSPLERDPRAAGRNPEPG